MHKLQFRFDSDVTASKMAGHSPPPPIVNYYAICIHSF